MFTRFTCWLSFLFILAVAGSAIDAWTPPALPSSNPQLPRLAKPLVVDGVLSEWGSAVGLPVRSASDIVWSNAPHRWRGAADAGMNCLLAWTPQGFAFAAEVADDDVYNDRDAKVSHEQDGLELFLDGRAAEKIGAGRTYATGNGAYQLCVRAPMPGKPTTVYAIGTPDGNLAGVQVAGARTRTGYTIELLVPWSAFPDCGAKEGAFLGVNVALDDYDRRDGKVVHPFAMTPAAQPMFKLLWQPLKFRLVETATADATAPLEPQVIFALPGMLAGANAARITADAAQPLAARIARYRVTITDSTGKTVFEQTVAPKRLSHRTDECLSGWPTWFVLPLPLVLQVLGSQCWNHQHTDCTAC